mgnify:CR=1 FL=1
MTSINNTITNSTTGTNNTPNTNNTNIMNNTNTNNTSQSTANRLFTLDPSQRVNISLYTNESIDQQCYKITNALNDDIFCIRLKQLVWEQIQLNDTNSNSNSNSTVSSNSNNKQLNKENNNTNTNTNTNTNLIDIKTKIKQCMLNCGYKNVVHNVVTRTYEKLRMHNMMHSAIVHKTISNSNNNTNMTAYSRQSCNEKNETIRNVRMQWERGINEELLAIGSEMKRKFAICRYVYICICVCLCVFMCMYVYMFVYG